jgi:putative ABC transport system permease protein
MPESPKRPLRPVPFAQRLVAHKKTRTAVAASGIAFAILVIFVQLGFYGAVLNTALAVSSRLNAELILVSPRFVHLNETGTIPRGRLFQVLAEPDVLSVSPLYIRNARWHDPVTGEHCRLLAIAFPLADAEQVPPLLLPDLPEQIDRLRTTNTLLLDRLTQPDCGPADPGSEVEVGDQPMLAVGDYRLGVGFLGDGSMIMSDTSFSRVFLTHSLNDPHLGLIKLRSGADAEAIAVRLRRALPGDVRLIHKAELNAYQTRHWVENTAVGNIFAMGSVAGFFVGVVVLFQILSTDIRNHLPLYATLQAMGYANRRLYRYVMEQSWMFAVLGFVPALLLSLVLFPTIHGITNLPIYLTFGLASLVLALSVLMCTMAGILSLQKLRKVDPAELF